MTDSWKRVFRLSLALGFVLGLCGSSPAANTAEPVIRGVLKTPDTDGGDFLEKARIRLYPAVSDHQRGLALLLGETLPEAHAEAELSDDGFFELSAPVGMWTLKVEAEGYLAMEASIAPLLEDLALADLELEPAVEVEVKVSGPGGSPVAGAQVSGRTGVSRSFRRAFRWTKWSPSRRAVMSDSEGRAVLHRAEEEGLVVRAFAPGWVEVKSEETKASEIALRLDAGREVALTVNDENSRAVAGVLVRVGEGNWPAGSTDENGVLKVHKKAAEKLRVSLSDEQGRSGAETLPADVGTRTSVMLPEPRRVSGRVLDAESRGPLPGALVWGTTAHSENTRADNQGSFSLKMGAEGDLSIQAAAAGYFSGFARIVNGAPLDTTFALKPAAAVRGVVVDSTGKAVARARVGARESSSGGRMRFFSGGGISLSRGHSDREGRFHLARLEPETAYTVTARKEGYAAGKTDLERLRPLATLESVRVVLTEGETAFGHVSDSRGEPVAGARINLSPGGNSRRVMFMRFRDRDGEPIEAYSDTDGRFEFVNLEAGTYELGASADGYAMTVLPGLDVPDDSGNVDLGSVTLEAGETIEGRVVDVDGKALEGAEVRAVESNPRNQMRARFAGATDKAHAVTAVDGFFSIADHRRGGKIDVIVTHAGYSAQTLSGVEVPPLEPVEIVMQPASSLSGKVLDPAGDPVPSAEVQASVEGGGATAGGMFIMTSTSGSTMTDDFGDFKLEGLDPGTVRVRVSARGFLSSEKGNVEIPAGEDVEGLEIELQPGASIAGRVVASDSTPVVGARVTFAERNDGFREPFSNARTDGDGRYFLHGVEPGRRLIEATHDDFGSTARELEVAEGENSLDLAFEGGVEVAGRVVDDTGAPVAGAAVFLSTSARSFGGRLRESTGGDGAFRFEGVREGTYFVNAVAEGFAITAGQQAVEVAGSPVFGIEVLLSQGGIITGRITGVEPADLASVQVFASSPPSKFAMGSVSHDGTYRVFDVGSGEWMVNATLESAGQAQGRVTVEPGEAETLLDLEFDSGIQVTGVVLRGDEPLSGVSVQLRGLDVLSGAVSTTDRAGRFSLKGVKPGKHSLVVMNFGRGVSHTEEHEIRSDHDLVVEIAVAQVSGYVVESGSSKAVIGASVRLEPLAEQDEFQRFFHRGSSTDSNGYFSIYNVAAGTYRLVAEKNGYTPASRNLTIEPNSHTEDLEFALSPTDGLTLRVRLPSGSAASRVSVAVVPPGGDEPIVAGVYRADQDGMVRLSKVPAGNWEFLVASAGSAVARFQATAPAASVPVSLRQAAVFEVRIDDLAEDPGIVKVEAIGNDGRPAPSLPRHSPLGSGWRMSFGRGRIDQLPPGTWLLRATASDGRTWKRRVSVAAGTNPPVTLE